ncbi:MAG TPA: Ig-like domain-containing protein [Candidatus Saccharimonadales bacterium]|nr:Ig-like domain-containing protein [Candidatus Saccharimonadales bacterium]
MVGLFVLGCVTSALSLRPKEPVLVPLTDGQQPISADSTLVGAQTPLPTPTVTKVGAEVQFSVDTTPYGGVQKVEFYVEQHFVGAAYSQPYSVAVNEDNLAAGTHTVTAKVYTPGSTTDSQPATFTAQPTVPPAPTADATASPATAAPAQPASVIAVPANLAATATTDGTSATLNWAASDGALSYLVWRDGVQIASPTGTGYTDTGLNPGQTYDYQVAAVAAHGTASDRSPLVAATMPVPQDTGPVNTSNAASPQSPDSSSSS